MFRGALSSKISRGVVRVQNSSLLHALKLILRFCHSRRKKTDCTGVTLDEQIYFRRTHQNAK